MASSKIKGITIEIGGNTTKLGKALEGVNKQSKDLQSELKGVNSLLKLDPSNVELLKQKQDLLTKSITETESKQKILAETLKQIDSGKVKVTEEQYRDLQREIVLTDNKLEKLTDEMKEFGSVSQAQLKAVGDNLKETGNKISEVGSNLTGASAVAGAGLVASGKLAADNEAAINRYLTATGTAVTETENFKSIMDDMYSNNYGESYQELAEKLALVKQNFKDISDTDLQSITENAYLLEDAFGMDFLESVRGINGLMTNMGLTSTEAFNLMVTGAQNGLNKSNELGDNIAEYSQLWGQAGFSAEEMFAILQNGLDSGAYNLDKVNDFVKEFSISLSDGRIEDNLGSFSTKSQDLFKAWQNGEASSKDVFYSIVSDLENMENKQEALTIASNVWSALGEDNAMSVITSLNDVNKTYLDTAGAVDQANETMYGGSSAKVQTAMRDIQTAFKNIGELLLPIIASISIKLSEMATKFSELSPTVQKVILVITSIAAAIGPVLIFVGKIITAVGQIMPILAKLGSILSKGKVILVALKGVIATIVGTLGLPVTIILGIIAVLVLLWNKCEWFRNLVKAMWEGIKTGLQVAYEFIVSILSSIGDFFVNLYQSVVQGLTDAWTWITDILSAVGQWIYDNVIAPVMAFFEPFFNWFKELFQSIGDFVRSVIDVIVGLFQGSIILIKAVWGLIANWFKENVIQPIINFFTPIVEFYRNLFQKAVDGIKTVFGVIVNWFKDRWTDISNIFSVVKTWFKDRFNEAITSIKNVFSPVVSFFKNTIWGGIKNAFGNVASWFKETFTKAWTNVKNVFSTGGKIFDGIKDGIASTFKTVVNGIIGGINKVISVPFNAINKLLNKIRNVSVAGIEPFKSLIKQNALSIPQIPKLNVGTNKVKSEGLAYLHKNEAVVPEKYNPAITNESTKSALFDALTDFTSIQSVKSASVQNENTKLIGLLEKYLPSIEAGLGQNIVLDDGTLVGKLTPKIDNSLGSLANRKRRGY